MEKEQIDTKSLMSSGMLDEDYGDQQINKSSSELVQGFGGSYQGPIRAGYCIHGQFKYTPKQLASLVMERENCLLDQIGRNLPQVLFSNTDQGIKGSAREIEERQLYYGKNVQPAPAIKSLKDIIMENFGDRINQLLIVAAIISIIIGLFREGVKGLIEGASILFALVIIITVSSANNYMSELKLAMLFKQQKEPQVAVYRNSPHPQTINASKLVVGDVYELQQGMFVPADSIVISSNGLEIDESSMTGETDLVSKQSYLEALESQSDEKSHICGLIATCSVANGQGVAIVVAVGEHSFVGQMTQYMIAPESQLTPLQERLEDIAFKIGNFGIICAVITFIANFIRILCELTKIIPCGCQNLFNCQPVPDCVPLNLSFSKENRLWTDMLDTFIILVALIVAAIPEGLPLAVTLSLSFGCQKMLQDNNLVRNLASCEVMGGSTFICTDKTGTLTCNKMTVCSCLSLEKIYQASFLNTFKNEFKETQQSIFIVKDSVFDIIMNCSLWNTTARIEKLQMQLDQRFEIYGSATDAGLMTFFMDLMGEKTCFQRQQSLKKEMILMRVPFSSQRKRETIAIKSEDGESVRVYCKGAAEIVLKSCSQLVDSQGTLLKISSLAKKVPEHLLEAHEANFSIQHDEIFRRAISKFAKESMRCILFAYKDISLKEFETMQDNVDLIEKDMVCLSLFAMMDPLKPQVVESIKLCKTAGIDVIMCTGDNIETAKAIAIQAGICTKEQANEPFTCMLGSEFNEAVGGLKKIDGKFGQENQLLGNVKKFRDIKSKLKVMARSSPLDKFTLVTALRDTKEVVAVTGDGTNDAPALKKADVGFSMGISGTDMAKSASDIIILDDNFSSIVKAVRYGRNIYDNVRKFMQFQLTVNVSAIFLVFLGSVVLKESPLNAVQMLWINLIMDTFAALALATEMPPDDILLRQPQSKDEPLITKVMWRNIIGHAVYQIIVISFMIFCYSDWLVYEYQQPCLQYATSLMQNCLLYDPFYTKDLYYTQSAVDSWNQMFYETQFDQALVGKFIFRDSESYIDISNRPRHLPLEGDGTQKLQHFTIIFQTFVFMQIFNQVNCKKLLETEINVFDKFFNNRLFIGIVLMTLVIQCLLVEFGGKVIQAAPLTVNQNLVCLGFGLSEIIWGFVVKCFPLKFFSCFYKDKEDEVDSQKPRSQSILSVSSMKSSTIGRRSSEYHLKR